MATNGKLSETGRLKLMDFSTGVEPVEERVLALYTDSLCQVEVLTVTAGGSPTGYSRKVVTFDPATIEPTTRAAETVASDVQFDIALEDWGNIRSVAVLSNPPAPRTPEIIWSTEINPSIPVLATQSLRFWQGLIKFSLE
jgi:hypothetical protein